MKNIKYLCCLFLAAITASSYISKQEDPKYLDPKLSVNERVTDLMSRMSLEEKIAQMCQYVGFEHIKEAEERRNKNLAENQDAYAFYPGMSTADLEKLVKDGKIGSFLHVVSPKEANQLQALAKKSRLKIPLLIGIDAIHGNGMVSGSTVYPSQLGMSCTWDTLAIRQIAIQTAKEMRATGSHWAFSPNLDVARDARWGRTGETFGEDPFLVSHMGAAMIKGLQGNRATGKDVVLACAKHLIGGSEPINGLNVAPTDLSERTLQEIYLPPYKAAVEAGALTFMPAHNEINGIPCHANRFLMNDLVRDQWGFKGFYVSDFLDIERLQNVHRIASTQKEAVYKTVNAGMDMHMHGPNFLEPLMELVKEGKISAERIDQSTRRILEAKFRLGLFEDSYIKEKDISRNVFVPEHQQLSLETARKSVVLLKNNALLPLDPTKFKKILVTGPNANSQSILGDWTLLQPEDKVSTILKGMVTESPKNCQIDFFDMGTSIPSLKKSQIDEAVKRATDYDLVVLCIGESSLRYSGPDQTAGENVDRDDISFPGLQPQLIAGLHATGKPIVAVVINARPLDFNFLKANVPAVIEAWEPGSFGGKAIAEIIWGKVNPSGKLTMSFPRSVGQIPVFYNRKPSQYVRKFFMAQQGPLYEFGEGLSYTSYSYSNLSLDKKSIRPGENITASVLVENTGKMDGEEIVQLYLNTPVNDVARAIKVLKGFRRIHLKVGEKKTVNFTLISSDMTTFDINLKESIDPGDFTVFVGPSSRSKDLLSTKFSVGKNK